MPYEMDMLVETFADIRVMGVGGGGNNAVNRMIEEGIEGVSFIAVNTNKSDLALSLAETKIQIGNSTTNGLGAGANPEVGQRSAEESKEILMEAINGADLLFITAGMGGGTGTGASHIVANIARELGILTIGVVTKPFGFEGKVRLANAEMGISLLTPQVDSLVTIPNDRLLKIADNKTSLKDAFRIADSVLVQGVKGISDLITKPGLVSLDFADVKTIMQEAGMAHMGMGYATGENKAAEAASQAIQSPLLETKIDGATGLLINITGGNDMTLFDVEKAAQIAKDSADPDANVIFGATIDQNMDDAMKITIIATGFEYVSHLSGGAGGKNVGGGFDIPDFLTKKQQQP
ncbi:MAG: cell division protein FtsZ [Eubacteriaceae bacterium]|jgi:cell division protein FtsZ|nr:cell division protein FtsZ [Eubacteriaceae bacterium]